MKKLLITAAALAMLAIPSFAQEKNRSETEKMRFEMRMQFMKMSDDMINGQMAMLKMHETMLTNYQRILKQMMENESSSH
jgi:energy-converting hydrogenase Eha subunit H